MPAINRVGIHFFLRTQRADSKGLSPIYMLLTHQWKKVALSTGLKVQEKKWNAELEKVISSDTSAQTINNSLDILKAKIIEAVNNLSYNEKPVTLSAISEIITEKEKRQYRKTLLYATQKHKEDMKSLLGVKFAYGNYKNYLTTEKYLTRFIKQEYKRNDFVLDELDLSFAKKFEKWLLLKTPSNHNGAMKHIQRLKKIINWSIQYSWLQKNPFTQFKISFDKHERGFLDEEEIVLLEKCTLTTDSLNAVRDIFLFQVYTGLAYSDVSKLKWEHIALNVEGKDWIMKNRQKTKVRSMVPLLMKARKILEAYEYRRKEEYIFKVPPNQKMNYMLKDIATEAGVTKNLTTHLGRHSFATTITLLKGVSIETVSKMLGHTKISTTQIYSKVTIQKISNDMDKLHDLF